MNTATILVLIVLFAMSALGHFLPQFTRPDVFFGITVDPAIRTTDAAHRILRDYRIALWCSAIAAGASIWVLHRAGVAFLIYVIGASGAQVASHRRALIHATTRSTTIEVDLSAPQEHIPGGFFVALLPFLALIGLGLWAVSHMNGLPDRLPVHVTVLAFVISLMRAGQGGARQTTVGGRPIGDRTADARWIGGLIYFNPTDPALLVEKRMGIGWTLNFGNPWSWVPLIAVAVILVIGPLPLQGSSNAALSMPLQPDDRGEPLKSRAASPGTEDSLRHYILSLEQGHPNYEEMSPQLAASVNRQLPKIKALIDGLGEFKSLTYEGTDSDGSDVYVAAFARGQLE